MAMGYVAGRYALIVGGADPHRMDLSSMVMLKDNHVAIAGSIKAAVASAKRVAGFSVKVEVEAGTLEQALEAAAAGADVVMLDNFTPEGLKAAAGTIKAAYPHVLLEGSGGITIDTIGAYFCADVDVFSVGKLTQELRPLDMSLKIVPAA